MSKNALKAIMRMDYLKPKAITEMGLEGKSENPEDQRADEMGEDIKNSLTKEGNNLVTIWVPPITHPQFYGMFTYASTIKLTLCKIKKYLFLKPSIS
jgi:hypothetical protein